METKTKRRQDIAVENDVVIDRVFKIPVSKVWRAITEPVDFKKWWGPNGYTCPSSSIEARKGGRYLNCMRSPEGKDSWSIGTVKEIIPEKKLVITDNFSDEKGNIVPAAEYDIPGDWPDQTLITFELKEVDDGTKFRVRHEGIPEEAHDDCVQGWNECLDKLAKNIK